MSLADMIRLASLKRPFGFPVWSRKVAVICFYEDLPHLPKIIGSFLTKDYLSILVIDRDDISDCDIEWVSKFPPNKISGLSKGKISLDSEIVFASNNYVWWKLNYAITKILAFGYNGFFVCMPMPCDHTSPCIPSFYDSHKNELEKLYGMLDDFESKKILAAKIRSLVTGNIGYLRLSDYPEYFHPMVRPVEGDIIIDGGISENISSQLRMCNNIGKNGRLYGFEPDPVGFTKAHKQINDKKLEGTFRLIHCGLWSEKCTTSFTSSGEGSRVANDHINPNTRCEMTTVDCFVKEQCLNNVTFIKLDVEGSEFNVLRSSVETIVRYKPRMAISVYHNPEDLFSLPLLIKKMLPKCRLYLGHHTSCTFETILYVLP